MNPFIEAILDGRSVDQRDVLLFNADRVEARVAAFKASPCKEAGGKRKCGKNCTHGQTNDQDIAFARTLRQEAAIHA